LFSHVQSRTEAGLQEQWAEFERLKREGADPKQLFLLAYERHVRLADEMRKYVVLGYQEMKSLTAAERRRLFEGEERIQHFLEEIIAYGVEQGVFPPGDIDLKAHCLIVLAQSWAVRHWALRRFAKLDDYLASLKIIALGVVKGDTLALGQVVTIPQGGEGIPVQL